MMVGAAEEKKPPRQNLHINIKVRSQDQKQLYFKIKRNTELGKLMTEYSNRKGLDYKTIVFLFHGQRLSGKQTPKDIGLDDGDEIDAMIHQNGGGCGPVDA